MERDVLIKNEGDYFTIGFQSEKAKNILKKYDQLKKLINDDDLIDGKIPKIDLLIDVKPAIISWCKDVGLTYEEF